MLRLRVEIILLGFCSGLIELPHVINLRKMNIGEEWKM